jgi:8-oxo-dGTP pyrophosphatase MutT (NUDIX family)
MGMRVGIIVLTQSKVLLIKRCKNNRTYWVFPGGHREKGERIIETAIRELAEETNLKAQKKDLTKILGYFSDYSQRREIFYSLSLVKPLPVEIVGEEKFRDNPQNHFKLVWYPLDQLEKIKNSLYSDEARNWLMNYFSEEYHRANLNQI